MDEAGGYDLIVWRVGCVLVASVLLVAGCSDDGQQATPPARESTTTVPPAPPQPVASPPPPAASYRAGRLADSAYVEGTDRWLTPPLEPTSKQLTGDCVSLADPGWQATCERVTTELGDAIWLTEHRGSQERVLIYLHRSGDLWDLALRASDDTGREFDASAGTYDLAGDGNEKIVVQLRGVDIDVSVPGPLQADVVEPDGTIVVHLVLSAGRNAPQVIPQPGRGLEVKDCDVDCVPAAHLQSRLIGYRDGAWRVVRRDLEPPEAETPAAGVCPGPDSEPTVSVSLEPGGPSPRCQKVSSHQRLVVINKTGETAEITFAHFRELTIAPNDQRTLDEPFGMYLAPGVHSLYATPYPGSGVEIWLV